MILKCKPAPRATILRLLDKLLILMGVNKIHYYHNLINLSGSNISNRFWFMYMKYSVKIWVLRAFKSIYEDIYLNEAH